MKEKIGNLAAALGRSNGKKGVLAVGGAICLATWAAFAVSMVIGAGSATQLVVLSVALVVTEMLFWVAAALFGITVIQLRRKLIAKLLPGVRGDAA